MASKLNSDEPGPTEHGEATSTAVSLPRGTSALPTEVRDFVADIGDLVTATTTLTGVDLARAKARLVERAAAAKASLVKMGSAVSDRARQTARVTDNYVHQSPWQAIGIGAALGVLVGFLIARRA